MTDQLKTIHGPHALAVAIALQRDELEASLKMVRDYLSNPMRVQPSPRTDRRVVEKINATLESVFGQNPKPAGQPEGDGHQNA